MMAVDVTTKQSGAVQRDKSVNWSDNKVPSKYLAKIHCGMFAGQTKPSAYCVLEQCSQLVGSIAGSDWLADLLPAPLSFFKHEFLNISIRKMLGFYFAENNAINTGHHR